MRQLTKYMLGVRVTLRPGLPALHDRRFVLRAIALDAELVGFPVDGRYRGLALYLHVAPLEVHRAYPKLEAEHDRLEALAIHLRDVGAAQQRLTDLPEHTQTFIYIYTHARTFGEPESTHSPIYIGTFTHIYLSIYLLLARTEGRERCSLFLLLHALLQPRFLINPLQTEVSYKFVKLWRYPLVMHERGSKSTRLTDFEFFF